MPDLIESVLSFITGRTLAAIYHVFTGLIGLGFLGWWVWLRGSDEDGHPRTPDRKRLWVVLHVASGFILASFAGWTTQVFPILGTFTVGERTFSWSLVLFRFAFAAIYSSMAFLGWAMASSVNAQIAAERKARRLLADHSERLDRLADKLPEGKQDRG